MRWSLFAFALPLGGFISFMGFIGTGFGGLTDSIPLLLVLPTQLCAIFSFRVATIGLWSLLAIHLLLPYRFGFTRPTWSDLAPARADTLFWAILLLITAATGFGRIQKDQTESPDIGRDDLRIQD
jgi:hypothetical protein